MQRRVTQSDQFSQEVQQARPLIEDYMHQGLGVDDIQVKLSMVHRIKITRQQVKAIVMRRA